MQCTQNIKLFAYLVDAFCVDYLRWGVKAWYCIENLKNLEKRAYKSLKVKVRKVVFALLGLAKQGVLIGLPWKVNYGVLLREHRRQWQDWQGSMWPKMQWRKMARKWASFSSQELWKIHTRLFSQPPEKLNWFMKMCHLKKHSTKMRANSARPLLGLSAV